MYEGTAAGQTSINRTTDELLSGIFATHSDRLTRFVFTRLDRPDWATAEDISQQVFLRLVDFVVQDLVDLDRSDDFVGQQLDLLARQEVAHHDRHVSTETPVDTSDWFEEARLPESASAEETALANITVIAMLSGVPALGVAA
ncbi:hypothetical protein ACIBI8_40490 [Streptomyces sp. NPDC050529]|uniref:hypothetical protein n=1 Tax=Streptomyces sp. NPDC050529 TaxID=3365624 RepID=UPI0037AC8B02